MKTIGELNERVWHRIFKVIYVLVLSSLIAVSVFLVIIMNDLPYNYLSKDQFLSKISAHMQERKGTKVPSDYNLTYSSDQAREKFGVYVYGEGMTYFQILAEGYKLENITDNKTLDKLGAILKTGYPQYKDMANLELGKRVWNKEFKKNAYGNKFTPVINMMKYSIVMIIIWLFAFEVIKRSYYYVSLGKIFPPIK